MELTHANRVSAMGPIDRLSITHGSKNQPIYKRQ